MLRLRYGIDGEPMTLEDIAKPMGYTRERARQVEAKALRKLRAVSQSVDVAALADIAMEAP